MSNIYTPNDLIDALVKSMHLKNDAALARRLEVAPPVISKIRHHRLPIGASFLVSAHEESGLSIADLKRVAGMPTKHQNSTGAA